MTVDNDDGPGLAARAAVAVALLAAVAAVAAPAVAQERPYNNSTGNVTHDNWTDGHEDVTVVNVSYYVSRVSAFVIGDDPDDAGAGPLFTGLLVAVLGITVMGTSRAGLVASGTMGVVATAGLSAQVGAGFLPRWLYGVVVLLVAFVAGVLYLRMVR